MPSLREGELAGERRTRGAVDTVLVWNRRVHYYVGLFLLFFMAVRVHWSSAEPPALAVCSVLAESDSEHN